ncbi:hypothetical protein DUNSADRAFT_1826 [Dunaliella salina]|uniref:Uncharacterized protein n=1 Tax=Dunaliella salina TaxID=3046 RepID=A0ABQ7FWZ2_DUNSA|nr:hypothetical protein DUNSADRAFT_1826 [Dunaliella salina]|eukprot:KAF5826880.1 hypothetical protein DUNSADRAFT_1826 [Dunaliella salina]
MHQLNWSKVSSMTFQGKPCHVLLASEESTALK